MKRLLISILAIIIIAFPLLAAGTGETKAEEKKTLVISTWGLSEDSLWQDVYEPFEKEYNCKIVLDLGTTQERLTKLINDPNSTVDVIELSQKNNADGVAANAFIPVSKDDIPVYGELMSAAQQIIDSGSGVPYTMNSLGIFYNPKVVGFEIKSWKDLWDPRLKGKIAIPAITSTFGPAFVVMCAETFGGDVSSDKGDFAFKKLTDLKNNVALTYSKSSDIANFIQNGEVAVAILGDFGFPVVSKADPEGVWVFPEEGTYVNFNAGNIAKTCHDIELAKAYLNYRTSKATGERMARAANETPVNTTVELTAEETKNMTVGEVAAKAHSVDFNIVNPLMSEWVDRFNQIMNQ